MAARLPHWLATSLWYSACVYRKSRRRNVRIRSLSGCSKISVSLSGAGAVLPEFLGGHRRILLDACVARKRRKRSSRSSPRLAGPSPDSCAWSVGHPIAQRFELAVVHDDVVRGRRRAARVTCAARIARACSSVEPSRACRRRICRSSLQSTTSTRSTCPAASCLHQQRDHEELIRPPRGLRALLHRARNGRMRERLEVRARRGVREDDARAARRDRGCRRRRARRRRSARRSAPAAGWPGRDDFAREHVRVDDGNAEGLEQARDRGFAAGDAAGEADAKARALIAAAHGCWPKSAEVAVHQLLAEHQHEPAGRGKEGAEGDRGRAVLALQRRASTMPTTAPTAAAIRMIGSSICQPSQAPSAASSLKSP